jgi:hypothetical protein
MHIAFLRLDLHLFVRVDCEQSDLLLRPQERHAEAEKTSHVLSKCDPKLLEQKGLGLVLKLGISSIDVGLGNKTRVRI